MYVVNTGAGATKQLKCKTITVQNGGETVIHEGMPNEAGLFGLIESADRVPGGVRVRGFVVTDTGPSVAVRPPHTRLPRPGKNRSAFTPFGFRFDCVPLSIATCSASMPKMGSFAGSLCTPRFVSLRA